MDVSLVGAVIIGLRPGDRPARHGHVHADDHADRLFPAGLPADRSANLVARALRRPEKYLGAGVAVRRRLRLCARHRSADARGRREATIVEVLQRNTQQLVGRFCLSGESRDGGSVIPENPRISQSITINRDDSMNAIARRILSTAPPRFALAGLASLRASFAVRRNRSSMAQRLRYETAIAAIPSITLGGCARPRSAHGKCAAAPGSGP